MRIALITQQLSETAFAHGYAALSRGLWELGIKDQHILYLKKELSEKISFPPDVRIIKLGINRIGLSPIWFARYINEAKPDVLITMPVFINIAVIVGRILSGNKQTKLIISERAILSYYVKTEGIKNPRYLILPWLLQFLYPKIDGLVVNNNSVLEDLESNMHLPINHFYQRTIPPAIDIQAIAYLKDEEPEKKIKKLIKKPLIISAGRLAKEKNFQLLIKAFKIIRERIDARLIILGEGPERSNLGRLISEIRVNEVYLPGYIDNPWSLMARSDVFVLSSEKEAFGRVLVEAMACGIPIVATDAIGSGPRYILNGGKYGALVKSNDEKVLAETILELLRFKAQRNHYIEGGRKRCEEFSPKIVAKEWLTFIEGITN